MRYPFYVVVFALVVAGLLSWAMFTGISGGIASIHLPPPALDQKPARRCTCEPGHCECCGCRTHASDKTGDRLDEIKLRVKTEMVRPPRSGVGVEGGGPCCKPAP